MRKRNSKANVLDKYWGKKAYMDAENDLRYHNMQKKFSANEKLFMLSEMIRYIEDNDIDLFHDFMDIICKQKADWFNMLAFDKQARDTVLTYIQFRVHDKQRGTALAKSIEINESCISKEEPLERNCTTCEFYSNVCKGYGTRTDTGEDTSGMPIEEALEMFPNWCDSYGISLAAYEILEERAGR